MQSLLNFFADRQSSGLPLVLATVVKTEGSTYSKAGEHLLVDQEGVYCGLLSGGCLEGDLALRAREVLETQSAQMVDYDFRGEDDELFGLGVGCEGALHILLQGLGVNNSYQPFNAIADTLNNDQSAVLVTSLNAPTLGASLLVSDRGTREFGLRASAVLVDAAKTVARAGKPAVHKISDGFVSGDVLFNCILPAPRFLVLGGGPDVVPLVRMANELGWRCCVVDHRPDYVTRLPAGIDARLVQTDSLSDTIQLNDYDRAIVMSHHLATDRSYLRQLAETELRYIGLLGPPARRDRLLLELGDAAEKLKQRLHGPAGINIGGRGPAVIALSVLAEIQHLFDQD